MNSQFTSPLVGRLRQGGWKAALMVGVVVGALAAMGSLMLPNYYRSEAKILPADQRSGGGGINGLAAAAATVGITMAGQDSADAAFVDILNSRWMRERLLTEKYAYKLQRFKWSAPDEVQGTLADYLEVANLDRGVRALGEVVTVRRDFKTKLITISIETRSPDLSQQVAQCVIKNLEAFLLDRGRTKGGNKAIFVEQRLAEARASYAQAEERVRVFLDGNRNYLTSPDPGVRLKGTRLESELKMQFQLLTTLTLSREQALIDEKNDMPILNVLDTPNLPYDKSRPGRSSIVLIAAFLGFAGVLTFQKWSGWRK